MTETEWLASEDPAAMLVAVVDRTLSGRPRLTDRVSDRKLRLFACACAWRMKSFGADIRPAALEESDYPAAQSSAQAWASPIAWGANFPQAEKAALQREIIGNPFRPVSRGQMVSCPQCFGHVLDRNEGCPHVAFSFTPTILSLAQAAYDERQADGTLDPFRVALVADALEEAGCVEESILRHLRGKQRVYGKLSDSWFWHPLDGPHVRGCWALDLIRGKE